MIAIFALYPMSLRFAGVTRTGGNYLAWQLFRRPNHDWAFYPSTVPEAMGWLVVALAVFGLVPPATGSHGGRSCCSAGSLCPVAFFQLWPVKGFQYLLPVAPAVALLAAHAVVHLPIRPASRPAGNVVARVASPPVPLASRRRRDRRIPADPDVVSASTRQRARRFLAGSGGVPGGREAGRWIDDHTPLNAHRSSPSARRWRTSSSSTGTARSSGLSVSPNPLHRNPVYEPVLNPDLQIRHSNLQYLVWDSFSASPVLVLLPATCWRYADRYHGRIVHQEFITVGTAAADRPQAGHHHLRGAAMRRGSPPGGGRSVAARGHGATAPRRDGRRGAAAALPSSSRRRRRSSTSSCSCRRTTPSTTTSAPTRAPTGCQRTRACPSTPPAPTPTDVRQAVPHRRAGRRRTSATTRASTTRSSTAAR